jgi:hypothetical protein
MVWPCSCPASDGSWQGAPTTRSTPYLRISTAQLRSSASIGKNSFHIVGLDSRGAIVLRQKWSRGQVEARLANMPPCLVGMEAYVGAHHLSRKLKEFGHDARLMPARYVRPYSKGQLLHPQKLPRHSFDAAAVKGQQRSSPAGDQLEGRNTRDYIMDRALGAAEKDGAAGGAFTHYDVRPHACASIFHPSPCFENVYARVPVRTAV